MKRIIGYYALMLLIPRIKPNSYKINEKGVMYIYYENQHGAFVLSEHIKLNKFTKLSFKRQQKIKKEIEKWGRRL